MFFTYFLKATSEYCNGYWHCLDSEIILGINPVIILPRVSESVSSENLMMCGQPRHTHTNKLSELALYFN